MGKHNLVNACRERLSTMVGSGTEVLQGELWYPSFIVRPSLVMAV